MARIPEPSSSPRRSSGRPPSDSSGSRSASASWPGAGRGRRRARVDRGRLPSGAAVLVLVDLDLLGDLLLLLALLRAEVEGVVAPLEGDRLLLDDLAAAAVAANLPSHFFSLETAEG